MGSNGSGKSSLLKTLSGQYEADYGSISINDSKVEGLSLEERSKFVSCVTQDVTKGTIGEMTLFENMMLSKMRGRDAKLSFYSSHEQEMRNKVSELGLGLEAYMGKPLSCLSGGQRQTIATVMSMLNVPELLLLDEHTSALDPQSGKLLMDYTAKKVMENKITTIMVTHKLQDAVRYGNRLIMMSQGKIVLDVSGQEKSAMSVEKLTSLFALNEK